MNYTYDLYLINNDKRKQFFGCVYTVPDPAIIFCECGEPIQIMQPSPYHPYQLPIIWLKDACAGCRSLDIKFRNKRILK